jgi:hypothetical protein
MVFEKGISRLFCLEESEGISQIFGLEVSFSLSLVYVDHLIITQMSPYQLISYNTGYLELARARIDYQFW